MTTVNFASLLAFSSTLYPYNSCEALKTSLLAYLPWGEQA